MGWGPPSTSCSPAVRRSTPPTVRPSCGRSPTPSRPPLPAKGGGRPRQRDIARRTVDEMYTEVAERLLGQEPELEEVQREFLLKALAYYTKFAGAGGDDPTARRAAAEAYRRVGDIQ